MSASPGDRGRPVGARDHHRRADLLVATVLTLFVLPAMYAAWYRIASPAAAGASA